MSRRLIVLVIGFIVIGTVVYIAFAQSESPTEQRWEYAVARPVAVTRDAFRPQIQTGVIVNDAGVEFEGPVYVWLDEMGESGWELIQIVEGAYYFKRAAVD